MKKIIVLAGALAAIGLTVVPEEASAQRGFGFRGGALSFRGGMGGFRMGGMGGGFRAPYIRPGGFGGGFRPAAIRSGGWGGGYGWGSRYGYYGGRYPYYGRSYGGYYPGWGGYGYYWPRRYYDNDNWGWGVVGGIAGLALGSALASNSYGGYGYPYGYAPAGAYYGGNNCYRERVRIRIEGTYRRVWRTVCY